MPDPELARLRARAADLPPSPDPGGPGPPTTHLAKTEAVGTYPTAAGRFFACRVQRLLGSEVEGGAGTLSDATDGLVRAYNVGSKVPPAGTLVVVTFVADRWVFRHD